LAAGGSTPLIERKKKEKDNAETQRLRRERGKYHEVGAEVADERKEEKADSSLRSE
jgi:hypothetical protein